MKIPMGEWSIKMMIMVTTMMLMLMIIIITINITNIYINFDNDNMRSSKRHVPFSFDFILKYYYYRTLNIAD